MTRLVPTESVMRVPRASLSVRGRRSQYGGTGPEGRVRSASGVGSVEPRMQTGADGARVDARAGAGAGEGRA